MITNPDRLARHRQIVENADVEYDPRDEAPTCPSSFDYWADDTRTILDRFTDQYGQVPDDGREWID